jgi:hypothetical protein
VKIFTDYQGRVVRLTDERLTHILEHPEMLGMQRALEETVRHPALVRIRNRFCSAIELSLLFWYTRW